MAIANSVKVGEAVVVRGFGLCTVTSTEGDRWKLATVDDRPDVVEIKVEKLDALLRPAMDRDTANDVHKLLMQKSGEPDVRDWGDQYLDLQMALRSGTPNEQAAILQQLYRVSKPEETQLLALNKLEDLLLPELALSLKKKKGTLRGQLHKGQPAFGYQAPDRDDDGPIEPLSTAPPGWETEGSFRVFSGKLAIGEYPSGESESALEENLFLNVIAPCPSGEWFALFRNNNEAYEHLVLTRDAAGRVVELLAKLEPLGEVPVEGGSLHVADQEICADRRYRRKMEEGGDILGRGYVAGMGGDGNTSIAGARGEDGTFCLIKIGWPEDADDGDNEGDAAGEGADAAFEINAESAVMLPRKNMEPGAEEKTPSFWSRILGRKG